jgi:isocitrate lyase
VPKRLLLSKYSYNTPIILKTKKKKKKPKLFFKKEKKIMVKSIHVISLNYKLLTGVEKIIERSLRYAKNNNLVIVVKFRQNT